LQPNLDAFGVKEKMVGEISSTFSGNVVVGEDLMEVPMAVAESGTAD